MNFMAFTSEITSKQRNALDSAREVIEELSAPQRVVAMKYLMDGFCEDCGELSPDANGQLCQCEKEE